MDLASAFRETASQVRAGRVRRRRRFAFVARYRFQILGAALLGIALPALVGLRFSLDYDAFTTSPQYTIAGTWAAVVLGFIIFRRMVAYPGLRNIYLVITSFLFSYLGAIVIFFFLRIDYSRLQFAMSFILTVSWFLFVASIERRVRFPCLFVFPYGDAAQLGSIDGARWIFAPTDVQLSLPFDGRTGSSPEIKGSDQLSIPDGTTGVVADLRADLPWQLEEFLAKCALEGIPVYHSKQVRESLTGRVTIEHLSENTFGSLIPSSVYFPVKRFVDCVVAIGLLPLVAVIGLLVAFAIKMEDGGSVFFKQQRIGYRGRSYTIIKFRTMTEGSERGDLFTADGDKRVTRVGRLLRRYRIDELPQILNILKGEMSWIGPRPESEPLSRWYESKIPFYRYRHIVMPGISGWAQVNQGNVAEIPGATDKLHYDFFYIKNFSASIDALIAIRTIGIVLGGFGAR